MPLLQVVVAQVEKVRFYANSIPSGTRMHIMLGHATAMAELDFFAFHHDHNPQG